MSRILRENNGTKAWQAIKHMIDKAVTEHNMSPRIQSQDSSSFANPPAPLPTSIRVDNPSDSNVSAYPALRGLHGYTLPGSSGQYAPQDLPAQIHEIPARSELLQPTQSIHGQDAPCWDDINLNNINNIVGDVQPALGMIPDFDFVSKLLNGRYCD